MLIIPISIFILFNPFKTKEKYKVKHNYILNISKKETNIGSLIIDKINLNQNIYDISNRKNNIEENVTILEGSNFPKLLILAAHSGTGKIAYFERLDELDINDTIILKYKNKTYKYTVKNIWEEEKNGYIHINPNIENQLVLTTCSPNHKNYQLIISSTN